MAIQKFVSRRNVVEREKKRREIKKKKMRRSEHRCAIEKYVSTKQPEGNAMSNANGVCMWNGVWSGVWVGCCLSMDTRMRAFIHSFIHLLERSERARE